PESFREKPELLGYPQSKIRYGHYGKSIPRMIEKCIEYREGEEKEALIKIIANMMKKSYLMWNRDTVNDELIADQLKDLSRGKLILKDLSVLQSTNDILKQTKPTTGSNNNNKKKRSSKGRKKRY